MSKDQNVRDEKKSRINAEGGVEGDDGAAAAALKQLAIEDAATALDAHENDGAASPFPDVCRVPVATISQNQSRASTTHSSLSTEGGDFRTEDAASAGGDKNIDGSAVPAGAVVQEGTLKRQVSQDSVNNRQQGDAAALDRSVSSASEETGGSANRGSPSVGNWGWFEDVHAHEGGFLPNTGGGDGAPSAASRRDSGGTPQRKKKKGGLLHIGSEIMQNVLAAIVEPNRQQRANTMAVTAPTYVLEESLSSQKLWKQTAGNRPPQPVEERAFFEQVWAQNFSRSKVKYEIPVEVLTASTPISISPFNDGFGEDGAGPGGNLSNYNLAAPFNMNEHAAADPASVKAAQADVAEATLNQHLSNGAVEMYFDPNRPKDYSLKTLGPHHHHHTLVNKKVNGVGEENDLTVVVRGDNVFGTTVSKSFPRVNDKGEVIDGIDTVSISIASYRVVESKKHGKYAQYLVIFCDGNFRNTVGVWKRYSDFSELSRKVTHGHTESCAAVVTGLNPLSVTDDHDVEILPNAITSWRLLKKRQRWYRCLDAGYLSLKVFLLERFLHDILFESSNPQILRDFVGVNSSEASKLNTKG